MNLYAGFPVLAVLAGAAMAAPAGKTPESRVDVVSEEVHGVKIDDPYRWLEDQNAPDTRAWLERQMSFTAGFLHDQPQRGAIKQRLTELLRVDTTQLPVKRGNLYFISRRKKDESQPVIYLRKGIRGPDEVLVDANKLSADRTTSAFVAEVSDDGKLMAYGVQVGGEDEQVIQIMDVATRRLLPYVLPRARHHGFSFKKDNSGFYYSRFEKDAAKVYYHAMGTDVAKDPELFRGANPDQLVTCSLSEDGQYLRIAVNHGVPPKRVEVYVKDIGKDGPLTPIIKDIDARFSTDIYKGHLYALTNWNAENQRVMRIDLADPARDKWKELIPEKAQALQAIDIVGGKLLLSYLKDVKTLTEVRDLDGKLIREMAYPTIGYSGLPSGQTNDDEAFYYFSSFAYPTTVFRYNVATGKQDVFARPDVPFDTASVEVKQVWYESKDKTRIPMFIAHKKGLKLDGTNPTYLTGYGGFTVVQSPIFSATAAWWIEQGGVYALPNLRGGGEFGEKWHRAGMFERKQNVFDDFIGAAEYLIANKYTRPDRLSIAGGSNGGLLVGAAMTQRPELFGAVYCAVPLLDMVRFHKFKVGSWWTAEYGKPDNPEDFRYLYKYSPYHQVKKDVKYPAVLFKTGDADTRVDPLHARKMTALVQASTGSAKPVLLRYSTKAGHSGGLPIEEQIEETADLLTFLSSQVMAPQGNRPK